MKSNQIDIATKTLVLEKYLSNNLKTISEISREINDSFENVQATLEKLVLMKRAFKIKYGNHYYYTKDCLKIIQPEYLSLDTNKENK